MVILPILNTLHIQCVIVYSETIPSSPPALNLHPFPGKVSQHSPQYTNYIVIHFIICNRKYTLPDFLHMMWVYCFVILNNYKWKYYFWTHTEFDLNQYMVSWAKLPMGSFDWGGGGGGGDVVIVLWVQFWIPLAAVSYRSIKVHTMASPAVWWVNKSRDRQSCIRNEPQYAICVIFSTHHITKPCKLILCHLTWQMTWNYHRVDSGHCDKTGHLTMAVLAITSDHGKFLNRVII